MHNQEENGVAVTTVTSNKISKERGKTMKNEKTSLNIRKLKKQVKGITLIALVVTIIVLLILAGIAINLTIGDNGIFKRAENARDTWEIAQSKEQSEMDKAADFIGIYEEGANTGKTVSEAISQNKFYTTNTTIKDDLENEVVIPAYFKLAADSATKVEDGIVIEDLDGNQFVWVPVENPNELFIITQEAIKLNGVETTTNVYSKLTNRSGLYAPGMPNEISKAREPDVLSRYDTDTQYYENILGFDSTKSMADSMVAEYKAMSDSIKKYNGFYIGRYELTGSVETPTEKAGKVLTGASNEAENWYNLYKACQNVVVGNNNVKSTMIYGVQWDAVCSWLSQNEYNTDSDSSSWGNYSDSLGDAAVEGTGSPQNTGYSEYWKANNIYDLAGNYMEWTQEAVGLNGRITRGGYYNLSDSYASHISYDDPYTPSSVNTSRATLYIL